MKEEDARALAKALGVSFEELTGEDQPSLPPGAESLPTDYVKIPLLGTCPASEKNITEDEVLRWEAVPREIVRGRRIYLLKVRGDSMNRAGIDDGDRVLVQADGPPRNGSIVVALIDGECCIKRYYRTEDRITLAPDSTNPVHQPMVFTNQDKANAQSDSCASLDGECPVTLLFDARF